MAAVSGAHSPEWVEIMVDLGASISALPLGIAENYRIAPPKTLTKYRTANGHIMFNRGDKNIIATLPGGVTKKMTFAVMKVNRPIASVSKIVKAGHSVTFSPEESYILESGGRKIPLRECNGIYLMWAKIEDPSYRSSRD